MGNEAEQLDSIVGEWRERLDRGEDADPEALIRAHPDLADALRTRFAAISALEGQTGDLRQVGEFRIIREIGRGGMGVVYEAEQASMQRRVALKVLFPSITNSSKAVKRFQQEARAAGRLKHTNIVAVYQLGSEKGIWYSAMELVEGRPLSDVIDELRRSQRKPRESRLARRARGTQSNAKSDFTGTKTGTRAYYIRIAEMFADVADALQVAHDQGVVHRDIKPGNLLLDAEGNLKLVDFGLARLESAPTLTMTGEIVGTPYYMSPEQLLGKSSALDHRTDVYSLGVTLCEALTLRPPFHGKNIQAVAKGILERDPIPPRRWDKTIPRDLETIVLKALEKQPQKRYANAEAMAHDLRCFALGEAIRARRISPLGRGWRKMKRHKVLASLATCLLIALAVAVALSLQLAGEAERRRTLAYAGLCGRAEHAAIAVFSRRASYDSVELEASVASPAEVFGEAIAMLPDQPEAYLGRAMAPGRTLEQRLSDLDAAHERGLPAHTWSLSRAHYLARAGRNEDAERASAQAAEQQGGAPLDGYFEARRLVDESRWADARQALSRVLASKETGQALRYIVLRLRVIASVREGDHALALQDLFWLQAMGDESAALHADIASVWRQKGDEPTAERTFGEALQTSEGGTERDWLVLLETLNHNKDYGWMERAARAALGEYGEAVECHTSLAVALYRLGHFEESLRAADRAIALDLNLAAAHGARGAALHGKGLLDEALASWREAIRLDPDNAIFHSNLGLALKSLGRFDEAIASFRESIRLDPDLALAHHNLGIAFQKKRLPDEAIASFREAIRLDPDDADSHYNLGNELKSLKRLDEAIASYREAIRVDPDHAYAHYNLSNTLKAEGLLDEAIASFREYIRLDPDDASTHYELGMALLQKREPDLDGGIAALREVTRLDPDDAHAYANLGMALGQKCDFHGSVAALRRAAALGAGMPPHFLADAERMAAAHARLPAVRRGEDRPATADEWKALADVCQRLKDHDAAARFFQQAFEASPALAVNLRNRYNAACSAAQAGTAEWRGQAAAWLRADLALRAEQVYGRRFPGVQPAAGALRHWLQDSDLAAIREEAELAKLPGAERESWRAFWRDVAALLAEASK